jgi:hypothetical protein
MITKTTKTKKLPNDLKLKIVWRGNQYLPGPLCPPEEWNDRVRLAHQRADDEVAAEKRRKLKSLAEHHGLDTTIPGWEIPLCYILAAERHTGFQVVTKTIGRPKQWGFEALLDLAVDVEATKRRLRKRQTSVEVTTAQAVRVMIDECVKAGKGRYLPKGRETAKSLGESLENRHSEAINHWFLSKIFAHPNSEEREAMVSPFLEVYRSQRKVCD